MKFPHLSRRKANAISNGIFFILLGILFYTQAWWPGILIAIGTMLAIRQYLTGRKVDFFITLSILALIALVSLTGLSLSLLLPVLFILGGIYLIAREYFFRDSQSLEENKD